MLLAPLFVLGAEAEPQGLEDWRRLHLEGRKLLVAKAHVDLERWPDEGRMRCRTELRALGMERGHLAYAWRPGPGQRRAWVEVSEGRKLRAGIRLPGPGGSLEVRRYKPDAAGAWGDLEVKDLELGKGEAALLDAWYALVELPRLAGPGPHRVLTKDGAIELHVARSAPWRETLRLRELEGGRRTSVEVELVELRLTRADADGETLLGLSGPTVLVFDQRSGALVEARGEKDGVPGTIRLRLTGYSATPATWSDPPIPEDTKARLAELDAACPNP